MQDVYGWKSASMCQEYISTSGPAIKKMAQTLGNFDCGEPVVEVLVKEDPLLVMEVLAEEDLSCFKMKEDPLMYQAAGISLVTADIQKSIESTLSSVPCVQGANVTIKVCVISNNTGTVNF